MLIICEKIGDDRSLARHRAVSSGDDRFVSVIDTALKKCWCGVGETCKNGVFTSGRKIAKRFYFPEATIILRLWYTLQKFVRDRI